MRKDGTPEIAMCDCNSTNIARHGDDAATRTLAIEFRNGGRWHYRDVPPEAYKAFAAAKSMGTHFHSAIRPQFKGSAVGERPKAKPAPKKRARARTRR
jgi:KTSC domain-containing protein